MRPWDSNFWIKKTLNFTQFTHIDYLAKIEIRWAGLLGRQWYSYLPLYAKNAWRNGKRRNTRFFCHIFLVGGISIGYAYEDITIFWIVKILLENARNLVIERVCPRDVGYSWTWPRAMSPRLHLWCPASSVARGGSSPPIGLWSMQNRTFLVLLRPIFGEKLKTAPLQRKLGAKVVKYMSWFGLKKRLNFRFWPKNQSQFWWRLFFLKISCFWAEKTFEFPSFPRNSVSIFGQTVWFWIKNNENSG